MFWWAQLLDASSRLGDLVRIDDSLPLFIQPAHEPVTVNERHIVALDHPGLEIIPEDDDRVHTFEACLLLASRGLRARHARRWMRLGRTCASTLAVGGAGG